MKNKEVMVWGKEVKQVSRSKKREQWKNQHTRKNSGKKKVKGGLIWILPLWGAFYVMLSSSSGRAEIRGSLFFYFFLFPCFFFFPFSLFLLFFLWEGGDQRCFSFTPQSVKLFFVFPSFFFFLEGENQMWFSFMPKALIFLHPDFLILHGIFSTARKMLT